MNKLLKRLNKEIIEWENLYGYWYTFLYHSDGSQIKAEINNELAYKNLRECQTVMQVLKQIKRNAMYDLKRMPKRKYKIAD